MTATEVSSKRPFLYATRAWKIHVDALGHISRLSPELQAKVNRINAKHEKDGTSELHCASFNGDKKIVKLLPQLGADIEA